MFKMYRGLPRPIYVIFISYIINNIGNFVNPFLTMYLTDKMGYSELVVGIFVSINAFVGLISSLIGGSIIDKIGRKNILIITRIIGFIIYFICAFLENSKVIPFLLIFSSFIMSLSLPVFGTMVSDLTEGEKRKAAYSLNYLAMNIGFAVGPILAGFLYRNHIKWLFLGDAITLIISGFLVYFMVPETKPTDEEIKVKRNDAQKAESGSLIRALLKRPEIIAFSGIIVLFFIVFAQFTYGLTLHTSELFLEDKAIKYGMLMTINAIAVCFTTVPITNILKKFKASFNIAIGGLLYFIGFGMLAVTYSFFGMIVSCIIWSLGEVCVSTNTNVYIANHAPITHRGRFNSLFPIIRKAGFGLGPIIMGVAVKNMGIFNSWFIIALIALIGTIGMLFLYREECK
jgi:MFS family permease